MKPLGLTTAEGKLLKAAVATAMACEWERIDKLRDRADAVHSADALKLYARAIDDKTLKYEALEKLLILITNSL